jgi:hypothetical protein
MQAMGESALGTLDFAPGPGGIWVDARRELAAVVCEAGVLLGWLGLEWDGDAVAQHVVRDAEHLPPSRLDELGSAAGRARAARRRALARCPLCDAGTLPGHLH